MHVGRKRKTPGAPITDSKHRVRRRCTDPLFRRTSRLSMGQGGLTPSRVPTTTSRRSNRPLRLREEERLRSLPAASAGTRLRRSQRDVGFPLVLSVAICNSRNVHEDFDRCYRAVQSKDPRFDGWFVTAVLTTKIYCRPSCPARSPFARPFLSDFRGSPACWVPCLQALPSGCVTGLSRVEYTRRCRGTCHASYRRRRG